MNKLRICIICTVVCFCSQLFARDKLIAYPVPFNPSKQTLQLKYSESTPTGIISVEIYDVNGDRIFKRSYSSITDFHWKGYGDTGGKASAGLYIVKVRCENTLTGSVRTDTVRILIKR